MFHLQYWHTSAFPFASLWKLVIAVFIFMFLAFQCEHQSPDFELTAVSNRSNSTEVNGLYGYKLVQVKTESSTKIFGIMGKEISGNSILWTGSSVSAICLSKVGKDKPAVPGLLISTIVSMCLYFGGHENPQLHAPQNKACNCGFSCPSGELDTEKEARRDGFVPFECCCTRVDSLLACPLVAGHCIVSFPHLSLPANSQSSPVAVCLFLWLSSPGKSLIVPPFPG